jgi:hypothetical protein
MFLKGLVMPLSWNEIKQRSIQFSKKWSGENREDAEAKSFWDEFFSVFGVLRRTVATFEEPVKNLKGQYGYIDLFWRGKLIVEHKSGGKDLEKASSQAFQYIQNLASSNRHDEIPRYVIVSDFARIVLHDLEPDEQQNLPLFAGLHIHTIEIPLSELHRHIHAFAFIAGYKQHRVDPEDPANIRAAEIMGKLHDAIKDGGYSGHQLERFLVRILFCLFAEDTGIFEPNAFSGYIENQTREDGSDLGLHLARIFQVLNTPDDKRQSNTVAELAAFPYVNGGLFAEALPFAELNRDMRAALIACLRFNWSRISPAVFGSLFQSVMEDKSRRQIGAHYTSERDILKVVRSLFLDDLRAEFDKIKTNKHKLAEFHRKLASLCFFDPACGCGNFLIVAYRELRLLEMEVFDALYSGFSFTDIRRLSTIVDVDQFYGIEIEEFPALIAETALWLMDHQMNVRLSERMGQYFQRLPLTKSATIRVGNSLRIDWKDVLPPEKCSYILGNPPFVGQHYQTVEQKHDQQLVMVNIQAQGVLDYVCNWYVKTGAYIQNTRIVCAFVSTNSISQGEQVGILWNELFSCYHLKIHFAHRTFPWMSEARGKAHVHVVIIGFGAFDASAKHLYEYDGDKITVREVRNISPYLVEGPDTVITNRTTPICEVPKMLWGNKPTDGGHLIMTSEEREQLLKIEPAAAEFIRPFMSGGDFIAGETRYCLWLVGVSPAVLRNLPNVMARIEAVQKFRLESKAESTRKYAAYPTLFRQIAQQTDSDYLAIPEVSSERRQYIPIAYLPKEVICSNKIQFVPEATLYHFGILTSAMHMAWIKQICGRLKSDFSYSNSLVYNNFPWPDPDDKRRMTIEQCAHTVLLARAKYSTSSLADLYDPLTMPPELVKAHNDLDRAVDLAYRTTMFTSDRARVEYLFSRYAELIAPLLKQTKKKRGSAKTESLDSKKR